MPFFPYACKVETSQRCCVPCAGSAPSHHMQLTVCTHRWLQLGAVSRLHASGPRATRSMQAETDHHPLTQQARGAGVRPAASPCSQQHVQVYARARHVLLPDDVMHAEHALDMVSMQRLKPTQCLLNRRVVPGLEAQAAFSGPLAASLAPPSPALAECRPPSWPPHQSRWGCLQSRPCLACTVTQSHAMQSNQAARTTSAIRGFALRTCWSGR